MLYKEGVNKIIILSHLGYEEDARLARSVAGIDVIIGGHSHTFMGGPGFKLLGLSPQMQYPVELSGP
jgi:5'-nucleotidase